MDSYVSGPPGTIGVNLRCPPAFVWEHGIVPVPSGALESQTLGARRHPKRQECIMDVGLGQLANCALGSGELGRQDRNAQLRVVGRSHRSAA